MSPSSLDELASLRPRLLGFAMLRLRNRDQAEDAVQETLLAALEGLHRFAGDSSLYTWAGGILKHKIADRVRGWSREQPIEPIEPDELPLPGSDPEEGLVRRRFYESLERSLMRLPEKTARAFFLREVMGHETVEVCDRLAVTAANCWVMVHRAKQGLRDCPEIRGLAADAL